ncbi:hypothetical protein XI06_35365 [Bradyrhizobium sp. CCBAU 11434]|uniref:hypothetical protein n=1 Tax=Bradyrhizobium sp. CCBAU 11434 TaxID=1630885 RepID=UPI002306AD3A|nr:hypothetical protein [Bradyrhizobium sp. CCBAU 11434]MDA9525454.1 hypothetical protein [Bradyrhizobium sp. CCBAU 11434]
MPFRQQDTANLVFVVASFVLFLVLAVNLYRFLRFVWARIPTRAISLQGPDIDKLISITFALIVVPGVAIFAWTTVGSFFTFLADQIHRLANLSMSSSAACAGDSISCLTASINGFLAQMADSLVKSLNFSDFPVADFVVFLLVVVLSSQIVSLLRKGLEAGQAQQWLDIAGRWFPKQTRERVVFAGLVLLAFYLGLSALLAIPLFQDKSQSQSLTVDALDKAMDPNTIKVAEFDKIFNEALPTLREVAEPKLVDSPAAAQLASRVSELFLQQKTTLQRAGGDLQDSWTSLRQSALNDQTGLREQAKSAFASGLEVGIGRKQTAQHYYDLFLWHQSVMQRLKISLRECQTRASSFNNIAGQTLEAIRTDLQTVSSDDDLTRKSDDVQQKLNGIYQTFDTAQKACHSANDDERSNIPRRPSFMEDLGAVGTWSKWLLRTGQMPVVIIVGLVGFSLLGATVSRAVRARQTDPDAASARLSLDDLLTVIAVGTTSAVVVFLAAYGGLAVIGGSAGDPNPYVLFATCLIGAVYSEDVWTWARTKGISSREESGAKARPRPNDASTTQVSPAAAAVTGPAPKVEPKQ